MPDGRLRISFLHSFVGSNAFARSSIAVMMDLLALSPCPHLSEVFPYIPSRKVHRLGLRYRSKLGLNFAFINSLAVTHGLLINRKPCCQHAFSMPC